MNRLVAATALAAALIGTPAIACTPPPGDQVEARARDLRAVTAIYEARIDDVVLHDPYGDNLDFIVTPTVAIWGASPPAPFRLSFEAGACTNWFFLMDGEVDEQPTDGLKVVVLANPDGLADGRWLFILRDGAPYADIFMRDWQAARAGRPLTRQP